MPVGATVNSYTVEYNIMGSVLTPKKVTYHQVLIIVSVIFC